MSRSERSLQRRHAFSGDFIIGSFGHLNGLESTPHRAPIGALDFLSVYVVLSEESLKIDHATNSPLVFLGGLPHKRKPTASQLQMQTICYEQLTRPDNFAIHPIDVYQTLFHCRIIVHCLAAHFGVL